MLVINDLSPKQAQRRFHIFFKFVFLTGNFFKSNPVASKCCAAVRQACLVCTDAGFFRRLRE